MSHDASDRIATRSEIKFFLVFLNFSFFCEIFYDFHTFFDSFF